MKIKDKIAQWIYNLIIFGIFALMIGLMISGIIWEFGKAAAVLKYLFGN